MSFELPKDFVDTVRAKFQKAHAAGDVVFADSTNECVEDSNFDFIVTYAPSLAKKPTQQNDPEQIQRSKDFNPFLNPEPELTVIADYADQYNILLNKFPITPNHLLLTTKQFKAQSAPLTPNDLIASLHILKSLQAGAKGDQFVGFYNCGDNSGASQPHKHLQFMKYPDNFLPFPSTIAASEGAFIANTNKEPLQDARLPFAHFILPLPRDEETLFDEDYLALAFASLLQRTLTILRDTEKPIAYNVVFTTKWLMVVPRSTPYYKEKLGINAAGFTGLILAKNKELHDLIIEDGPLNVLAAVGFPNTSGEATDEYHY